LLEKLLGKHYPKWKVDFGTEFLRDLDGLIQSGRLRYLGKGTLKAGQPWGHIFEGEGLTLILRGDGSYWTLMKSGEGLANTIQMLP
jgi:hypothetical protein